MQALRHILEVENHSLKIQLPKDFDANKVEIIILAIEEQTPISKNIANFRGRLNLTDIQYKDFQNDVKKSREAW